MNKIRRIFNSAAFSPARTITSVALLPALVLLLVTAAEAAVAQTFTGPSKVWLGLQQTTLDSRPIDWQWLRDKYRGGKLLSEFGPSIKNVKGIIVPVFDGGKCFYTSALEPYKDTSPDAAADEELLNSFIRDCSQKDIPVFLRLDLLRWSKGGRQEPDPGSLLAKRPAWQEVNPEIDKSISDALFVSPFNKEVRSSLSALLAEIGHRFPKSKGVVLDIGLDDREIKGFSLEARIAAIGELGFDPLDLNLANRAHEQNNSRVAKWIEWRRQSVATFLHSLSESYRRAKPDGLILTSGIADYYERQEFNDLRVSQDWNLWLDKRLADSVLLEGRWLPRYGTARYLQDFYSDDKLHSNKKGSVSAIIPVMSGSRLTEDASYQKDWRSISRRVPDLDEALMVVRNDAELKEAVELTSGVIAPPNTLNIKVDEVAPAIALLDVDGKSWDSEKIRGQSSALWVIYNSQGKSPALPLGFAQRVKNAVREKTKAYFVTDQADANIAGQGFINLLDRTHELISAFAPGVHLVTIDKAGFVRQIQHVPHPDKPPVIHVPDVDATYPGLEIDKPAPSFSMLDMNGALRRVSDLRGKKNLLLTFFPKCFTGGCANHLNSVQANLQDLAAADVEVWAVSIDPADLQIAFSNKLRLKFPLIPDTQRQLCFLYGAAQKTTDLAARQSVLIDKKGIVRYLDKEVKIDTHGTDILARIKQLNLNG